MVGVVIALLVGVAAGYAAGASNAPSVGTPASDDATTVVGSADCSLDGEDLEVVDGVATIAEDFSCELDLGDPRVSGSETLIVTSRLVPGTPGGTWTAEGVLTAAGGTWRGTGQGVVSLVGNLPAGGAGQAPANYGEMRYVGEGDYDGLVFHYYFAGTNEDEGISGWIEDASGGE